MTKIGHLQLNHTLKGPCTYIRADPVTEYKFLYKNPYNFQQTLNMNS